MVILLKYVVVSLLLFGCLDSVFRTPKMCCDSDCKMPISYGRTVVRHITKEKGFLSYPSTAIVTVFVKGALHTDEGEFWEAEIQGKRGLILGTSINELTFKCSPVPVLQEDDLSEEEDHDDGMPASQEAGLHETPPTSSDPDTDNSPPGYHSPHQTPPPMVNPMEGVASEQRDDGEVVMDGSKVYEDEFDNSEQLNHGPPSSEDDNDDNAEPEFHDEDDDDFGEGDLKSSSFQSSEQSGEDDSRTLELSDGSTIIPSGTLSLSESFVTRVDETPPIRVEHSSAPTEEQPVPSVESVPVLQHVAGDSHEDHKQEDSEDFEDAADEVPTEDSARMGFDEEERYQDMEFSVGVATNDEDGDDLKPFENEPKLSDDVGGNLEPDHSTLHTYTPTPSPSHFERQAVFEQDEEEDPEMHRDGEPSQVEEESQDDDIEAHSGDDYAREREEEIIQRRIEQRMREMTEGGGLTSSRVPERMQTWREQHRLRDTILVPSPSPVNFGSGNEDQKPPVFDDKYVPSFDESDASGDSYRDKSEKERDLVETPLPHQNGELDKHESDLPVEDDIGDPVQRSDDVTFQDDEDYDDDDWFKDDYLRENENNDENGEYDSTTKSPNVSSTEHQATTMSNTQQAHTQSTITREINGAPTLLNIRSTPSSHHEYNPGDHLSNENVEQSQETAATPLREPVEEEEWSTTDTEPETTPTADPATYTEATPTHTDEDTHYEGLIQRPPLDSEGNHCTADNCQSTEEENEGDDKVKVPENGLQDEKPYSVEGLKTLLRRYRQWLGKQESEMVWVSVVLSGLVWLSAFYPILGVYCLDSCRKSRSIKKMKSNRSKLDKMVIDLRNAKGEAVTKARGTEEKVQTQQTSLDQLKQELAELSQSKTQLETHYQSVTNSLENSQFEITQYQEQLQQLGIQLGHEQAQVSAQLEEKSTALQQVGYLSQQLQELQQTVLGLEGTKDQLEQDKFNMQTCLNEMEIKRDEVAKELEEAKKLREALEVELTSSKTDSQQLKDSLVAKEQEIERMSDLLSAMTSSGGDGEAGGTREEVVRSMLDTKKALDDLGQVTQERDELTTNLHDKLQELEKIQADNTDLSTQVTSLDSEKQLALENVRTLECQMAGLKTLFQETQERLQSQVFDKQRQRGIDKTREADLLEQLEKETAAKEKAREEMDKFRDQLREMEEAYRAQVLEHQQRATESLTDMRKTEQALKQANKEIISLRKQLAEAEAEAASIMRPIPMSHAHPPWRPRPPSTGLPSQLPAQGARQPPRPDSAPRLGPRTSSPNTSLATTLPLAPPTSSSHYLNTSVPTFGPSRSTELQTAGPPNSMPVARPSSTSPSNHSHVRQQSLDQQRSSPPPPANQATTPAFATTVPPPPQTLPRRASGPAMATPQPSPFSHPHPQLQAPTTTTTSAGQMPPSQVPPMSQIPPGQMPPVRQIPPTIAGQMPPVRQFPPRGPDSAQVPYSAAVTDPAAMAPRMMMPPRGPPPPHHYAGPPYAGRPRPPPPGHGYPPRMPYRHRSEPHPPMMRPPPPRFMGPGYGPSAAPIPSHNPGSVPAQAPPDSTPAQVPNQVLGTGTVQGSSYTQADDSQA